MPLVGPASETSVCAIVEAPHQYVGRTVVVSGWVFAHHRGTSIFPEAECSAGNLVIGPTLGPVPGSTIFSEALGLDWNQSSRGEVFIRVKGTVEPSTSPQYSDVEIIPLEYLEVIGTADSARRSH